MQPLEQLQRACLNRNLIPFVGSGVSQGAAGVVDWPGLLAKGIEYIRRNKKTLNVSRPKLEALAATEKAGQLLDGFRMLQEALGAPNSDHYRAFLLEQFDERTVADQSTLNAIRRLGARVVVTTNYDLLLEQHVVVPHGESVTWLEPRDIFSVLRGGRGVIHLHGRYDHPASVILSTVDYERIVRRPEDGLRVAQALFHSGVLVFIGCSAAGVQDPHLSRMLEEFANLQGPLLERAQPHFILFKKGVPQIELAAARRLGPKPVIYGASYADLPKFLNAIPRPASSMAPTDELRMSLQTLRGAQSLEETFGNFREIIERVIYPGRKVRIGFAAKLEESGKIHLRNKYLIPGAATHNDFNYPQTLAAWALIEGRMLAIPSDWDRPCDFDLVRRLNKLPRVRKALMETSSKDDPVLAEFLDARAIQRKTAQKKLTIRDIYTTAHK